MNTTQEKLEDLIHRVKELAGTPLLALQSRGKGWTLEILPGNYYHMNSIRILADTIEEAITKADKHLHGYENLTHKEP